MPKSRVRKSRRRTARRRRAPSTGQGREHVATLRAGQDMTHLMTDEDIEHMDAHIGAAARGDAHEALWHLQQTLQVEGSLTPHKLHELAMLGDEAPGWMYSRWCVEQAYRWMLVERDPRTDDAVVQTMIAAHAEQADEVANDAMLLSRARDRASRRPTGCASSSRSSSTAGCWTSSTSRPRHPWSSAATRFASGPKRG